IQYAQPPPLQLATIRLDHLLPHSAFILECNSHFRELPFGGFARTGKELFEQLLWEERRSYVTPRLFTKRRGNDQTCSKSGREYQSQRTSHPHSTVRGRMRAVVHTRHRSPQMTSNALNALGKSCPRAVQSVASAGADQRPRASWCGCRLRSYLPP